MSLDLRKLSLMLLGAFMLAVTGCQVGPSQHAVRLGDSALLELARYWPQTPVQQLQNITWSHPEHGTQRFLASSYLHAKGLTVVGFSPLGQELWRAAITPQQPLQAQGIAPFDDLRLARAIMADLQLQQWPIAVLQQQLHNATITATDTTRQVKNHAGNVLWQGQNSGAHTTINNYVGGYQLTIELLEQQVVAANYQDNP